MGHRNGSAPVRWRSEGWEYRCPSCYGSTAWWPLTDEFWDKRAGMLRCRACWAAKWRRDEAARRAVDPEARRAHDRARYRRNRRVVLVKRREYFQRNREAILAKARARYGRRRAA